MSADPARTPDPTDPEDLKIITLARSTRARSGAAEGACVRDTDGRTYAAGAVSLPSLRLSALQVAVAMSASSGVTGLEAAAVVTAAHTVDEAGVAAVRDAGGSGLPIYRADVTGTVGGVLTT
ncbi:MAG: cytidine deaminase [Propionibacteriales bacterium]|nr:cytidine deaminase [Propionibacteriales bacterium]